MFRFTIRDVLWLTVVVALGCSSSKPHEFDVGVDRTSIADSHVMLLLYKQKAVAGFWANPSQGGLPGIFNNQQCGAVFSLPNEQFVEWKSTVVNGKVTSLVIDHKPYDIQKGNFFLILHCDATTTVEQLSIDLATIVPGPQSLGKAAFENAIKAIASHEKIAPLVLGTSDK